MTSYTEIYNRYLEQDQRARAISRENLRHKFEIAGAVGREVSSGLWGATKAVGRGIANTYRFTADAASTAIGTYADARKYRESEDLINPSNPRKTLENNVANAKTEFQTADAAYDAKKQEVRRNLKATRTPATTSFWQDLKGFAKRPVDYIKPEANSHYAGRNWLRTLYGKIKDEHLETNPDVTALRTATENKNRAYKTIRPGINKTIADYTSDAKKYQKLESWAEKLRTFGVEATPLQVLALMGGYVDKFASFARPTEKDKIPKVKFKVRTPSGDQDIELPFDEYVKTHIQMNLANAQADAMRAQAAYFAAMYGTPFGAPASGTGARPGPGYTYTGAAAGGAGAGPFAGSPFGTPFSGAGPTIIVP